MPCPPLQEDPFERKWVEVLPSSIAGAGDGLFAKRRLSEGASVAFYNGIRVRPGEEPPFRSINYEIYVDWVNVPVRTDIKRGFYVLLNCTVGIIDTWQLIEHKSLFLKGARSDYMDLPEKYTSVDCYKASLGHKINHSFNPNCKWDIIIHPVFGRIPRIVSLREIQPGEELTCHYVRAMPVTSEHVCLNS
jgi:histone-lysine N-methyltransferase SETD7